jgi:hypothetical protein
MAKPVSNVDPEKLLGDLFQVDEGLPCPEGTHLLFAFLKATDLINLQNSSFAGIEEWEAFSRHYGSCELCNA